MTERSEPGYEEDTSNLSGPQASGVARKGLVRFSAEAGREQPRGNEHDLPEDFKERLISVIKGFNKGINRRRLFFEVFKVNIEDASDTQRDAFKEGLRELIHERIVNKVTMARGRNKGMERFMLPRPEAPPPDETLVVAASGSVDQLVIPPYFRDNVRTLLVNNGGKVHTAEVIETLFPNQDMTEESYRILTSAMAKLVDDGMLIDQGEDQYIAGQGVAAEDSSSLARRRGRASAAERAALEDMMSQAGVKQPQPAKPSKKRRRNRGNS